MIPSGGACLAGDATCAAYQKAGVPFNLTVQGACWTVDGQTDFSGDPITPNFQMAAIPLSANLVAPFPGTNASLGVPTVTIGSGDGGTKTVSQSVSEVGVFTISVTPPALGYFGLTIPGSTTPNIGRFTPDHFGLTGTLQTRSDLLPATGSTFTYMGEPMLATLTLTAYNAADLPTQNYAGLFARLDATTLCNGNLATCSLAANSANWFNTGCTGTTECMGLGAVNAATGLSNRLAIDTASTGSSSPSSSWSAGVGTFGAFLTFSRPTTLVPDATWGSFDALNVGGMPRDSDGVTMPGPASADTHRVNLEIALAEPLA